MKIHELGHVVLYVSHLEDIASFYKDVLGFQEIHRDSGVALFSGGRTHHELLLIEVGGSKKTVDSNRVPQPGLYHIGFKVGDTHEDLRKVYKELKERGVSIIGMSDHTVTESLYIADPDNNELELYIDKGEDWKKHPELILTPTKRLSLD
jgi:catechol-2,3-dioxygenase